jgi:DNA-binding IclR family transcriptional regulator
MRWSSPTPKRLLRPAYGRPQGANQQAVIRALKRAKGEALGLTRLAAVAQIDKSKVLQALPPLVQKGLVLETGEEGARRWELV